MKSPTVAQWLGELHTYHGVPDDLRARLPKLSPGFAPGEALRVIDETLDLLDDQALIDDLLALWQEGRRFRRVLLNSAQGGTASDVVIAKAQRENMIFGVKVNGWCERIYRRLEEAGYRTGDLMHVQRIGGVERFFAGDRRLADVVDENLALLDELIGELKGDAGERLR